MLLKFEKLKKNNVVIIAPPLISLFSFWSSCDSDAMSPELVLPFSCLSFSCAILSTLFYGIFY